MDKPSSGFPVESEVVYLAKKDFGLDSYLEKNPTHDGRGVIVGVIDDGISPHQIGFQKTTTGERKYIKHFSNSSFYQVEVTPNINNDSKQLSGILHEESFSLDLNGNNLNESFPIEVRLPRGDETHEQICVDLDLNNDFSDKECVHSFNKTGQFLTLNEGLDALMLEFNRESNIVKFNEGESFGDSHGEGVASVLAGHNIGGKFDGVAPGAKIIDYDLSEKGANQKESEQDTMHDINKPITLDDLTNPDKN